MPELIATCTCRSCRVSPPMMQWVLRGWHSEKKAEDKCESWRALARSLLFVFHMCAPGLEMRPASIQGRPLFEEHGTCTCTVPLVLRSEAWTCTWVHTCRVHVLYVCLNVMCASAETLVCYMCCTYMYIYMHMWKYMYRCVGHCWHHIHVCTCMFTLKVID